MSMFTRVLYNTVSQIGKRAWVTDRHANGLLTSLEFQASFYHISGFRVVFKYELNHAGFWWSNLKYSAMIKHSQCVFFFFSLLARFAFAACNANCNADSANRSLFIYRFTSIQITPSSVFYNFFLFFISTSLSKRHIVSSRIIGTFNEK